MDIHVREQRLPGIGHRYELALDGGRRLTIVVQEGGRREIGLHSVGDEPDVAVSLTQEQAVALAALLSGARFSIDSSDDNRIAADEVVVETVTLGADSPAVGRAVSDIRLVDDPDAAVLAVIRDQTPELIEDETTEPCRPGDRVVVAVRRQHLASVARQPAG